MLTECDVSTSIFPVHEIFNHPQRMKFLIQILKVLTTGLSIYQDILHQ